jgi:hypothetical protein
VLLDLAHVTAKGPIVGSCVCWLHPSQLMGRRHKAPGVFLRAATPSDEDDLPPKRISIQNVRLDIGPAGSSTSQISYFQAPPSPQKGIPAKPGTEISWILPHDDETPTQDNEWRDPAYVEYVADITLVPKARRRTASVRHLSSLMLCSNLLT